MNLETVKIKAKDPEQGDFVVINKADFDPAIHELLDAPDTDKAMTKAELQAALDEKGIDYKPAQNKAELQALLDAA